MSPLYIGIDIGGTSIKWMIVNSDGDVVAEGHRDSYGDVSQKAANLASELTGKYPQIVGVGVICPGIVDEDKGTVVYAANLKISGLPLAAIIEDACQRPTILGHDGRAAGLAEGILGAGRGVSSFIMMPIGTGISVALCLDGKLWPGHVFCAGEVGHTPIFPDGDECRCGQRGCLETYASAKGIARRYARLTGNDIGARAVEDRLGIDPFARDVWDTAINALALGLTHLVLAVDPARIILGGGLSHAGETLLAPVRQRLGELLCWRDTPDIVAAELAGSAGCWGAAILGCQAAGTKDYERWSL